MSRTPTSGSTSKSNETFEASKFLHGFGTLSPEQMRRKKIVKRGFNLSIMLCGASGSGKSTFINSLCNKTIFPAGGAQVAPELQDQDSGFHIQETKTEFEEDGTVIKLNVVEGPGFGENVDNTACCQTLIDYLETQFDDILREETRVKRNPKFLDNRVHAVLYFITPTSHGLQECDIQTMQALATRANVIPVISKADTLTADELHLNKRLIMEDIREYKIPIYFFPYTGDDDETIEENMMLREMTPFAVVSSNTEYKIDGRTCRARQYPWGLVEVDDASHSDFAQLRNVLFGSHMHDLKEITHDYFYEKYRTKKLSNGDENTVSTEERLSSSFPSALNHQYVERKRLKEIEATVQREIEAKKRDLMRQEAQLKELTERLRTEDRIRHEAPSRERVASKG
ncbi:Cell division control protein 11 [Yarrowia sp. B02]|nr:Cell division control protein 11 [Yarrowia sp. B02]